MPILCCPDAVSKPVPTDHQQVNAEGKRPNQPRHGGGSKIIVLEAIFNIAQQDSSPRTINLENQAA